MLEKDKVETRLMNTKNKSWYILTILLVLFLHFSIIKVETFFITFLLLLLPIWDLMTFQITPKVRRFYLISYLSLIILPIINIDIYDFKEFIKTYILYLVFITQMFIVISYKIKNFIKLSVLRQYIMVFQYILVVYAALQVLLFYYAGIGILYNPWGSFQFINQYDYMKYINNIRATAFYLEPSVLGLVLMMLFLIRIMLDLKLSKSNLFVTLIGMYFTNSMSANVTFLGITLYYLNSKLKSKSLKLLIFIVFIFIVLAMHQYIPRFDEYQEEGSSTYWRFVAPVIILMDLLPNHLTGMPFGSYKDVISSYGLYNGPNIGDTIDNGHLLLIYYFGIITCFFYLLIGYVFMKTNIIYYKLYIIYFLLVYNFSGAIFNMEYEFAIFVLPIFVLKLMRKEQCLST